MSLPTGPRAPMTSTHHFSRPALLADGARASVGLLLTVGPLVLLETAAVVTWALAGLSLLFAWFGARTLARHRSRVVLSPRGVDLVGPRPTSIRWAEIDDVRLGYFAPRRAQPKQGWMQLTLHDRTGQTLRLDSTLERFDDLLSEVHQVASSAGLDLDQTTASNFAALGLTEPPPDAKAPDPWPPDDDPRLR
ncbi:MAG: hypothetical protein R3349_10455 [Geminicoccaceae bacterium]|nr:hypothetical protein [Geminicoccaceae bacterium]